MARHRLTDGDLAFLVETLSPQVTDRGRLKQILLEDRDFRNSFVGDEKVFRSVMGDDQAFLRVSPTLFFEILLRKAARELGASTHTLERAGSIRVPVFDTGEVAEFLAEETHLLYLADMLASFTRIESYTFSFRIRKGIWRKIRFNDFDVHSLARLSEAVEAPHRFGFFKRIADVCLFVLGVFPDHAEADYRYPSSGHLRPQVRGRARMSPEAYETEGRRFYGLASEHEAAREHDLSRVLWDLHRGFHKARKPLSFIAEHYLRYRREQVFSPLH